MDANRTTHAHSEQDAHIYGDCHATRAHRHGDLYPKFYPVANRHTLADRYTITDANGSTTDSDTDPHGNQYADDTAITRDGTEPTGHTSHDNHTAALVDPDANGGV